MASEAKAQIDSTPFTAGRAGSRFWSLGERELRESLSGDCRRLSRANLNRNLRYGQERVMDQTAMH